jgi:hypothetical protein
MKRVLRTLALAAALGGAGSCGDGTGPVAGVLTVSLRTPNAGTDGAILLTVQSPLTVLGPSVPTSVTAASGLRVFTLTPLAATNHFAVTGPLPNGAILTIGVPDVSRAGQYSVTIQDVAANDYTLRALTGYSLTITQ